MMKDKLVKTGHKKVYHRFFRGLRVLGATVGLLSLSAVPVLVSFTAVTQTKAKAVDEPIKVEANDAKTDNVAVSEAPIED